MTIDLTPEQEQRLGELAAASDRTPEAVAQEFLQGYLRHVNELADAVREGEESAEREGWLTHDEVFERLHQRLSKAA
jgi:predicted transcriptional regulator